MKNLKQTSYLIKHGTLLRTGISKGCLLLPLLFCIVLKVPANAVKEEKSTKMGKE